MKGAELGVLATPVIQCLEQLTLTGEQSDIQCLMGQLQLIGQQLEVSIIIPVEFKDGLLTFIDGQQRKNGQTFYLHTRLFH